MKRNVFISALIIALFLSLSLSMNGCGGDSNVSREGGVDNTSIVGTWDLIGITSTAGGKTYTVPSDEIEADPLTYTFYDDNTGVQYYKGQESSLQWSTSGNILYTDSSSYTYSVNSTTLKLTFQVTSDDDGITYTITHTFTRRKEAQK